MRKSRMLDREEVDFLLRIKYEDVDMPLIKKMFADTKNGNRMFNTYDKFALPSGKFYNSKTIITTAGRYIVNLMIFPKQYLEVHGYVNIELTKKSLGGIEGTMADMIINDELPTLDYAKYLDVAQWLGFGSAYFINPSMSYNINNPIKEVIDRRDELFDIHADMLSKGDIGTTKNIEDELLDMTTKEWIKQGEESYDYFTSGIGKYSNNFKKTSVMGGAIENPATGEYTITKSNYFQGMTKEELPIFNNLTISGGYGRGVETQNTGYELKKITNAMQTTLLGDKDSDCGTTHYLEVSMVKNIVNMFRSRYANINGKLVLLESDDLKKLIGTKIKFRSPMFCKSDEICNKCAGELHMKLGIKNVGLVSSAIGGTMSNLAMKKFHDASVSMGDINIDDFIHRK